MRGRRIPVVIFVTDSLSGVVSWSERLRTAFERHPRYRIQRIGCNTTPQRSPEFDGYARSKRDARRILEGLPGGLVACNYIWDVVDVIGRRPDLAARLRCLGFCHSDSVEEYYNPLQWYAPLFAQFIAVSTTCADRLRDRLPERTADIATIPYGVEIAAAPRQPARSGAISLIYAGRMAQEQKRVLDLAALAVSLERRGVDFRLTLAGDGEQRHLLERTLAPLAARGLVRFCGALPPRRVAALLREHDVFVQLSEFEGTSNSLLEAMAQGVVPVVTRTASGTVVEPGASGELVPVGDVEATAEVLAALAGDRSRLAELGRNAFATARRYAIDETVPRLVERFDLARAAPPGQGPDGRRKLPIRGAVLTRHHRLRNFGQRLGRLLSRHRQVQA